MKATGIVRRNDDLGHIVIPKEIRIPSETVGVYPVPEEKLFSGLNYYKFYGNILPIG